MLGGDLCVFRNEPTSGVKRKVQNGGAEGRAGELEGQEGEASGSMVLNLPTLNSLQLQGKKKREKKSMSIYVDSISNTVSDLDLTITL